MRSNARPLAEAGELTETVKGKGVFALRRFRTRREDLEKLGHATGCAGCRSANRVTTAVGRAEGRRRIIAEELGKIGDERLEREKEKLFDFLGEEENKRRKAKFTSGGDAKMNVGTPTTAISSSAPAGEVLRTK